MKTLPPAPVGRKLLACAAFAAAAFVNLRGQTAPVTQLENYVVTATRTAQPAMQVGAGADTLDATELAQRQITTPRAALGLLAGAPMAATGPAGSVDSLFLRGANSNQTLFLVDGIRLNDPNTDYQVWLGGASLGAGDRIELARGPQSTLYGGEAIGGVVSITAQRGTGAPTASLGAEGGSFGTLAGNFAAQGASDAWAYNLSGGAGHTNNARPNNGFDAANFVMRLDRTLSNQASVGGTLRWFNGKLGSPGDRFTNDPNDTNTENNVLETVFLQFAPADHWSGKLTLGGQERRFVSETPAPNPPYFGPSATNTVVNTRAVLDGQMSYDGFTTHRITFGTTDEADHTSNDGFGAINRRQTLLAVFAEDEWTPLENVFLTGGLRRDDFDTFGSATTGRATAAWLAVPKTLKLRASYGTGFRSPSFLDLYGVDPFFVGNPNLKPENARGGDAGADYYLPEQRGTLSATYFRTDYHNLIVSDFSVFPSTEVNVDRARTQGVELAAKLALPDATELRLAYTYLDAKDLSTNTRLLRRPRHSGNVDLWHDFGGGVSGGAGATFAAQRQDVDAQTFLTVTDKDYLVARVYAAWQVNDRLTVKARTENLLNKKYEDVNGYPALGIGAFVGAEWKF